jgi:predicted DCC family thiol-disulfide oxidoreductase YuxK
MLKVIMEKIKIFYDAKCIVCDTEINLYKKKDINGVFEYVDITAPDFKKIEIDSHTLNKYFHIQLLDGTFVRGVDAFMEIWKRLPAWSVLEKITNNIIFRPILNLGYKGFIYIRPYLPRRKDCVDDYCSR